MVSCLAAFAVLTVAIIAGPLPHLDENVRHWAVTHQGHGVRRVALDARWFGDIRLALPALLVVAGCVAAARRRPLLFAKTIAIAVGTVLAVVVLKAVIGRSNAPVAPHAVLHAGGRGYPSGHTATAAVCWGLLAAVLGSAVPKLRVPVAAAATVVVAATAASVVYGPAHWLTDAVASLLLGAAAVAGWYAVGGAHLSRRRRS